MYHSSRPAIALLFLCPLVGCGSRDQAPAPEISEKAEAPTPKPAPNISKKVPAPTPKNSKIPADVSYQITADGEEGPSRRLVEVSLNRKVTTEVLHEIALEVRAKEGRRHEQTAIFYFLPAEFPELADMPWAITRFNPALDVKILGFTRQEEDAMRGLRLDHKGKRIGAWLPDNQYKTLDLIYDDGGAVRIAEILSPTERSDSDMIELPSSTGRRFKKAKGSNLYDVDRAGNLRISNAEGQVIAASRPIR